MAIQAVITGLREGTPLTVICAADDMPCDDTVRNWADNDPELARDIARARETGFDAIALDALRIADTPEEGVVVVTDEEGEVKETRQDMLGHRKLRVETRLKLLAKWDPKRYGDKVQAELSGPDGGAIKTEQIRNDFDVVASAIASLVERAGSQRVDGETDARAASEPSL